MLQHLSVKNYALINQLELELGNGLSVVTGETGAGKSIILGALGLILGNRADLKILRNPEKKCVVEGSFNLSKEKYGEFFEENDLDFESPCIIRREISPSGKSRAFINDIPVTLNVLNELSQSVIDVHSQHDTLLLRDDAFQLELLDSFAENDGELKTYRDILSEWKSLNRKLEVFNGSVDVEGKDVDYIKFLTDEIAEAKLEPGEQEMLEDELKVLENAQEIQESLASAIVSIEDDFGQGIHQKLREILQSLRHLGGYHEDYNALAERIESVRIEVDDIRNELEDRSGDIDNDPNRLVKVEERLSQLIHLQKKHAVDSVEELIEKGKELNEKMDVLSNFEERKAELEKEIHETEHRLGNAAKNLSHTRQAVIQPIESKINQLLTDLKMPDSRFEIDLISGQDFTASGTDKVLFTFSANAGERTQPLHKVASGGELSRVMLALKATMAEKNELPSIIFDEIDTGVSGETAGKIGQILRKMGKGMQVVAITHLPQIASAGATHYKVLKQVEDGHAQTSIIPLGENERLNELARLLSGEEITDAALANAKNLLTHIGAN